MQEELRITFFVIGILFIAGILLHGAWTIRKNKKQNKPNNFQEGRGFEPRFDNKQGDPSNDTNSDPDDIYDDVGVSQARVISPGNVSPLRKKFSAQFDESNENHSNIKDPADASSPSRPLWSANDDLPDSLEPSAKLTEDNDLDDKRPVTTSASHQRITSKADASKATQTKSTIAPVYSGVVTQPKPKFAKQNKAFDGTDDTHPIQGPPESLLRKAESSNTPINIPTDAVVKKSDEYKSEPPISNDTDKHQDAKHMVNDFSLNLQEGPFKRSPIPAETKPAGVEKELSFAEQAKRFVSRRKKTIAEKIRKEPVVRGSGHRSDDQMRIDFETSRSFEHSEQPTENKSDFKVEQHASIDSPKRNTNQDGRSAQSDVLVLNVRANVDHPIGGAALLPMLLTLGFKFGEHDIFHRHVNTNGKGPILFSLTNMFKPGVFDIDNIENFTTQGVSLFMMLPIEGEAQQVFNMMHNAARKIAEEFDCRILDGNKVLLSKQSLQHYSERIREIERTRFSRQ